MLELLFALTGIIFGLLLGYIAPEEVHPGEKYFLWLKRGLLLGIFILIFYYSLSNYMLFIISALILVNFLLELKFKSNYFEIPYYILLIIFYLLTPFTLLAILVFLYGLPTGTLLFRKLL